MKECNYCDNHYCDLHDMHISTRTDMEPPTLVLCNGCYDWSKRDKSE